MAEAVGLNVVRLHRTMFSGITLKGLALGNWVELEGRDMEIVSEAIANTGVGGGNDKNIYDDDIE